MIISNESRIARVKEVTYYNKMRVLEFRVTLRYPVAPPPPRGRGGKDKQPNKQATHSPTKWVENNPGVLEKNQTKKCGVHMELPEMWDLALELL